MINKGEGKVSKSGKFLVAFGILFVSLAICSRSGNNSIETDKQSIIVQPTITIQSVAEVASRATATLVVIPKIEFNEITRNYETAGWTELQFNEYKDTLKGLRIENWQGNVIDVKESLFGDTYIEVDIPGTKDTVDVFLYTSKDLAISLTKGQEITFSGTISGLYPGLFEDWKVEIKNATVK